MKKIALKRKLFSTSLLLLLAILCLVFALIIPKVRHIKELHTSIYSTHKQVETDHEHVKETRRLLSDMKQSILLEKELHQALLSKGRELEMITSFEQLAQLHNIDQTLTVSLQPVSGIPFLPLSQLKKLGVEEVYVIAVTNQGAFESLLAYLHAIETLPYYVIIDTLQWEKKGNKTQENNSVSLRFDAYILISQ